MGALARWWDGVELWSTGLTFPVQVLLVLAVVAPLAALAARGLDRIVGAVSAVVPRRGGVASEQEQPLPRLGGVSPSNRIRLALLVLVLLVVVGYLVRAL